MESFISTFVNKVDRKGRVSVPATFRTALIGQRFNGVVVFASFVLDALEGSGGDYIDDIAAGLDQYDQYSDAYENLSLLLAETQRLPFDSEGRVLLPELLKQHAHIEDEAVFVGRGRTFQIWEPGRFADHRALVRDRFRAQGQTLPARGLARRDTPQ